MRMMHEQLIFRVRHVESLVAHPKSPCRCPCILTIRLDPLKPSVLDAGMGDPHAWVRNVFHAEAPRDGRGAATCNRNNHKELGVVDGEERCTGAPMLIRAASPRASALAPRLRVASRSRGDRSADPSTSLGMTEQCMSRECARHAREWTM